jgi:hypothetical integral membrane protein (TIGR02206 family)
VFGTEHLVILAVAAVGAVAAYLLGRRLGDRAARRFEVVAGTTILLVCAPFEVVDWTHGPQLQLCDFAWLVAAGALLTRSRGIAAIAYFWGLTLSVQGVLTPDLAHGFPSAELWGFLSRHLSPVWVAVYLVGARRGPSWRGLALTTAITAAWAAAMMVLNAVQDTNYGYLNAKPETRSLLDLLGPWPLYVVLEIVLVVAVWSLMTWPWNRSRT